MLPQSAIPLIPQKAPFVMVDELLHADETTAKCSFIIRKDNPLVDQGIFQEGGLLENIAQTAAAQAGYKAQAENKPVAAGFIGSVRDFEVFALPKTGDELITEITVEDQVFDVTVISGKVWHSAKLLASCEMKIFIQQNNV
ncbi:3-hydroxyacyl-ACP dehydratase [Mucilaginibacter jinjuensis]|uniref:3-hydroxyacyl-ACP dehydratase n=1 Tax=Mucilaginibacter jinjuensis TaxID=1176721 RepID=A0ABY7T7E9_9SPHI|nr:3-hydroxyacyl-ACP dehydratase [Mucilaginibacter jinjuensis]WCT12189.1 3-hydroxyacyl-ACP dehydratase [Mucilaginibacter jinjuensis]